MRDRYIISNQLDKIGNIAHAFTTRVCGGIGDILKEQIGFDSNKIFTVKQVHGDNIHIIKGHGSRVMGHGLLAPCPLPLAPKQIEADAIITNKRAFPIAVFTADCLPVILADIKGKAVGIVHAGRVGTSLEISKKTVLKIMEEFLISSKDIIAVIGPGIGECCYEVDDNCINPFKERFSYWRDIAIKKDNEKWMLDIKKANRMQLIEAGLKQENILTTNFCTYCHNDRFFSYRKEGKQAGRIISFVAIKE